MPYHRERAPKSFPTGHTRPHFHPFPKSRVGISSTTFSIVGQSQVHWLSNWPRPHLHYNGSGNGINSKKRKQAETLLLEICIVPRVIARDQVTKLDMRGITDGWRSHGGDAAGNISPHGSLVQVKQGLMREWRMHGHVKNGMYPKTRKRLIFRRVCDVEWDSLQFPRRVVSFC